MRDVADPGFEEVRSARSRRRCVRLALVLVGVVAVAVPESAASDPAAPFAGRALPDVSAAVALRAPDFTVQTLDGKSFRLSAQRGEVVVVDFLVPGCGECEVEAPSLERTARRFASQGVRVLILDVSGLDSSALRSFYTEQYRLRKTSVAPDRGFRVAREYRMNRLGLTFVIGRDRVITWRGTWLGDERKLARAIRAALA